MVSESTTDLKLLLNQLSTSSEGDLLDSLSALVQLTTDLKCSSISQDQQSPLFAVLPSILSVLLSKSKCPDQGLLQVTEILSNLFLSTPLYLGHSKFQEALRLCVDLEKPLYQNLAQEARPGSWNPEIRPESEETQQWRIGLAVGSKLDAVKWEVQSDRKCWARGLVAGLEEGLLKISFEEEGEECDRLLDRGSHEIGIYNTRSKNDSWRDKLRPGSLVDCIDASNIWYNSTVLERRETENTHRSFTTEVLIGFRVYETYGEKTDEKGNYRGWSSKFDTWISIRSPKLAPFGMNGRMWVIPHVNHTEEGIIDDSNDMLETEPNTFCVTRPKKCSSVVLVKVLNRFGAAGYFDYILNTLADTERWAGFDVVYTFTCVVGKVYSLYHKKFAMNYVLKFKDAVFNTLMHAPLSNYREYSKEKLDVIFELLENLLKRVLTINQKNSMVDEFLLNFSLKNFETPYLERRIHGLKGIIDAVSKTKYMKSRGLQAIELSKWLQSHDVLSEIFGLTGHYQLVQRSVEIIKLLANENALNHETLEKIWAASQRNDEDMRKSVYQVLTEVNTTLKVDSLEFIVRKIAELPPNKIMKEEIDLMYELTKYTVRAGNASVRACDFFNNVVLKSTEYSETARDLCMESYCNLLKSWEKAKIRPAVMAQCVESIRENRATLPAIKIIEKLLTTFTVTYCSKDTPTRNSVVQDLINDQGAITALFDSIKQFKEQIAADPGFRPNYSEEIQARLGFLKTMISECYTIRLTARQLEMLWELLYIGAELEYQKEVFIKWLSETTENQLSGRKIFEDPDITKFFHEKLNDLQKDYSGMTLNEFAVFKNCFLLVNISSNNMKRLYSNMSLSTAEMLAEFDYGIQVPPICLHGMGCLRKIVIDSAVDKVTLQASDLLYEVYTHVSERNLKEIREELLNYFLAIVREGSLDKKRRALESTKRFIEESEKDGTGNLKSHSSLLRGDLCHINVTNNISYHPYAPEIPKKFEVKIYSNSTLWQLRCTIGKTVKCMYDQFRIFKSFSNSEIKDRENGKTLSNLNFKAMENLSLTRRNITRPKAALISSDNKLNPRAERIFRDLFLKYADKEDKMSAEGCSAFTNSCTGDHCKPTDKKTQEFIANHDSDHDGLLTADDFVRFYTNSCLIKPTTVWNNLTSHHYRHDLRRFDDSEEDELVAEALPTMILIRDHRNFDLLFSILEEKVLANDAWELVTRLPTSPYILQQVSEAGRATDWKGIFSQSSWHSLAYILQIIDSFMEDPAEENPVEFEKNRKWRMNFMKSNGLFDLFGILKNLEGDLDTFQKVCLASVLKIVCFFISAAFSAHNPEIYATLELVRKGSEEINVFEEVEEQPKKLDVVAKPVADPGKQTASQSFKALVEDIIAEEFSDCENIIRSLDFDELITTLLKLMSRALAQEEYSPENNHILDSALELWISCILHRHELLRTVYSFSSPISFEEFLVQSLTRPKTVVIRRTFCQAYLSISEKTEYPAQAPVPYFLRTLLQYIQNISHSDDNTQLYELTTQLIGLDKANPSQDYLSLAVYFSEKIFAHPCTEKKSSNAPDRTLLGLLKLEEKIFQCYPDYKSHVFTPEMLEKFFKAFLFPDIQSFEGLEYDLNYLQNQLQLHPPKAKLRETRNSAYKLLSTLSTSSLASLELVISLLHNVKSRVKPTKLWAYSPTSEMRSPHGYAGIVNLGCICYMNSMLQQFYMIPQLRYSILAANTHKPPKISVLEKTGEAINDNILYQLQCLFTYLELTDRNAYNPMAFCFAFKDTSGNPTNTAVQQDSQEFLNMILDKLDRELKDTPHQYLTQGVFGGQSCSQVICKECSNINETTEDFYNLSVDVKHSKTLYESLQKLISGDTISDYHCEKCDRKVDITRRTVISKLPNVLIVHLQRIVFNFDTYANEKINSRLEFPQEFNIFPYTKQGLEGGESTAEFTYALVGIVVHSGTADLGHYYSYIRENASPASKKWLEFNDSSIRAFK